MKFKIFLLLLSFNYVLSAQKNIFIVELGSSFDITHKASGLSAGFYYQHQLYQQLSFGLDLNHNLHQRRGILPKDASKKYLIRDYFNSDGAEKSYPSIRLKSKPDQFFDFGGAFYLNYSFFKEKKQNLTLGIGARLNFHDEKTIFKLIKGSAPSILGDDSVDAYFPIIRYDSYIDLGASLQAIYQHDVSEKLSIGLHLRFYAYPLSDNYLMSLSAFIGRRF